MHKYRTHNCTELNLKNKNEQIILSGWINKKRDHGNLLFIDLRDNFGLTQCVIDKSNKFFKELEKTQLESVIKVQGAVVERTRETINPELKTGEIEIKIVSLLRSTTTPSTLITFSNCVFSKSLKNLLLLSITHCVKP